VEESNYDITHWKNKQKQREPRKEDIYVQLIAKGKNKKIKKRRMIMKKRVKRDVRRHAMPCTADGRINGRDEVSPSA